MKFKLILIGLFFFVSCEKQETNPPTLDVILAKVGEKVITKNDFIQRCEYTPRPAYCGNDSYIHKKIALNSLIAEKLLSRLFKEKGFQLSESQSQFVIGRKEQEMRKFMFKKFGYDKVSIDDDKVKLMASLYNRRYEIIYYSCLENESYKIKTMNKENRFELVSYIKNQFYDIKNFKKVLSTNDNMLPKVREDLYGENPQKGVLYGPYILEDGQYFYFEIDGWLDQVDVTNKQKLDTYNATLQDYRALESLKKYSLYVSSIMKGKSINFNKNVFDEFSSILSKTYFISKSKRDSTFENAIWDNSEIIDHSSINLNLNLELLTLLNHDNNNWSVSDVLGLIKNHPLVFRKKNINKSNFKKELKHSIVDLIRDMHITSIAYSHKIDEEFNVLQNSSMWEDHISSIIISNAIVKDKKQNYIKNLTNENSNNIQINFDVFDSIKLSRIPMYVKEKNSAYPVSVPVFPELTSSHLIDYGKKMVIKKW